MADPTLVLRDIHQPVAPPWWPPAPGWWWLAALLLLAIASWAWFAVRRRRRQRAIAAIFDQALAGADTPSAQVAAMSELLRRAARRRDPEADRLHGDAWLQFLDGSHADAGKPRGRKPAAKPRADSASFSQGPGRLLLDGGYRREVDGGQVTELRAIARARFLDWMASK
jgi:hypothetical protein